MKFLNEMSLEDAARPPLVRLCQAFHARVQAAMQEFKDELGRCAAVLAAAIAMTGQLELCWRLRVYVRTAESDSKREGE